MGNDSKTEQLTVNFYEVNAGWLNYKITAAQQYFNNAFSHVFDPLPELKRWLEAISIGVRQASFQYNNEGSLIKFVLERISWKKEILTISNVHDSGQVFLKAKVDRRQMVKEFYHGLLTFANSDKFISTEWEIEYIKERLFKFLNIDEETLIQQLTDLDRSELIALLFNADPAYSVSYPDIEDKNEELMMFIEDSISGDKDFPGEHRRVETRDEWPVPDDYDFWKTDRKREYVTECINERTAGGYSGMKISDFSSSIIDKFLEEE